MKQTLYLVFSGLLAVAAGGCAHPRQNEVRSPVERRAVATPVIPSSPVVATNLVATDPPLTNNVTLQQLTAIALQRNPELRIFEAEVAAARGEAIAAKTWQNPEATAGYRVGRLNGGGAPTSVEWLHGQLGLEQTILFPGKRTLQRAVAEKNVEGRQLALAGFRSQLAIQVRRAYYTLLAAQEVLPLRDQRLALAKTFVEAARKKVDAGIAPDFEATKAEVEVVNAQAALRLAQAQVVTARAALNALLGRNPSEPLGVTGTLSPDVRLWDERQLLEQTLARNPSLKIQAAEIERTGLNLRLVRKSRHPDFTVGPGYESEPGLQIFSFGVSLPIPLWDQKKGPIATATAEQQRAVSELEKLRQEILRDVTSAAQNLAAVKEALANYTPDFIARLRASLDAASQSYSEGRTPLLLFLETQRTYFETQASYFESLQKLYESQAELESAIGVPLEELSKP